LAASELPPPLTPSSALWSKPEIQQKRMNATFTRQNIFGWLHNLTNKITNFSDLLWPDPYTKIIVQVNVA
jgi:hypothetical protein